jgi:putative restriction endonuclease
LSEQTAIHGEILSRDLLQKGFVLGGERIPLISPQGIFKPRIMKDMPLSITSAPSGPYDDAFSRDGLLQYRYRGTNPEHADNRGLRLAKEQRVPLVYFFGITPGKYLAVWPVFVVGDDRKALTFSVAVDDIAYVRMKPGGVATQESFDPANLLGRRIYATEMVRRRLHQQVFREKVLQAYRTQCACCRLRHPELLDAAHIIPDSEPEGEPAVSNGISLCKLHHAAFDAFIFGITPDYLIHVRPDVLEEEDGPMLLHGLQGLNSQKIVLPRSKLLLPDRGLLEKRFQRFKKANGAEPFRSDP